MRACIEAIVGSIYSGASARGLRRLVAIGVTLALAGAALPVPALAQSFLDPEVSARQRAQQRKAVRPLRATVARPVAERTAVQTRRAASATPRVVPEKPIQAPKADAGLQPPDPLVAVISIARQRMVVYGSQGVVAETKVSTGQAGHRTPTGVFSVLQRNRYHHSNIYSGAPMPFMQRLTWSGIALHQGVVPGYPASHGCIRMPADFAPRMWGLGRIGMRVLIAPDDVQPEPIEHARLPAPAMTALDGGELSVQPVQTVALGGQAAGQSRVLAPYPLAHFRRAKAVASQQAAERQIKGAQEAAQEKAGDANRASEALRALEGAVARAEEVLAQKNEALARLQTAGADAPEALAVAAATADLERLRQEFARAKVEERRASDAAFDAAKELKSLQHQAEEAAQQARLASTSLEPISIFVSRKEGKVFVRQGFVPLHEEEITFSAPERPLGTHVYTAIDAREGGAGLRWQVVTLPSTPPPAGEASRRRGGSPPPQTVVPASTAIEALERFELPPETLKLVGDRLWSGATLIISDYGISGETGRGTDFVVLTH